uniref:U10-barytoxin-Tl1a n=1 Tax=Trittame loki TaxID=1295018 RepID=ICK3_TRILK|nr:RecName: Full=U10-barytoxin-Tl1a; Short=U10-BATX-Tl1a; AltName: Full=Toxin ICK-3; Flags: Precursor [Trittame loki]
MKTLVLVAVLGVASLYLLSSASEVQQLSPAEEEFRAFVSTFGGLFETEERGVDSEDCRAMFGGCGEDNDCCLHLGCKTTKLPPFANPYCAWDGTTGRK